MCGCQGFLGCEISFPSKLLLFSGPLSSSTFAQSKQICSFDGGDTHTRSIDLVGVESALSAIEVKDSQMKPETPNGSHATPHFWREMQMGTHQARQVDLSRLRLVCVAGVRKRPCAREEGGGERLQGSHCFRLPAY